MGFVSGTVGIWLGMFPSSYPMHRGVSDDLAILVLASTGAAGRIYWSRNTAFEKVYCLLPLPFIMGCISCFV